MKEMETHHHGMMFVDQKPRPSPLPQTGLISVDSNTLFHSLYYPPANYRLRDYLLNMDLPSYPAQILRGRLKQTGRHGRDDVIKSYGNSGNRGEDQYVGAMMQLLDDERSNLRDWAKQLIKARMLESARMSGMLLVGDKIVMKFRDIGKSWLADRSTDNAAKLYRVLFGDYEGINQNWMETQERVYMKIMRKTYRDENGPERPRSKGCYEKIISDVKTTQVKLVCRAAGATLRMSRPGEIVAQATGGRRAPERRQLGDFYLYNEAQVSDGVWRAAYGAKVEGAGGLDG